MSVRGYADYNPGQEAAWWILRTREVLSEYRDYLPLSTRQIFYRLVAEHEYPKSEQDYGRLTQILSRARRAGMVPWDAIRDGGLGDSKEANFFVDEDHFERTIRHAAEELMLNRQEGQEQIVEVWCEAGGMFPILEDIAKPYAARTNTGGGYDSVTAKHQLACRVRDRAKQGLRTVVLHIGDFDPSGEDMANALRDDVSYMVASQVFEHVEGGPDPSDEGARVRWALDFFELERVALTAEQVLERNVLTAPPKPTDSRRAAFVKRNAWLADELGTTDITAQLEALTPPELNELVSQAIESHLDMDVYNGVLAEEEPIRTSLLDWLDSK